MTKHNDGTRHSEVDLEARKAHMARIAEEADGKEAEESASMGKAVGDNADSVSRKGRAAKKSEQIIETRETAHSSLTDPAPNPFNPAALRLDQSFADTVGVKKLVTTVPVRKPNKQDFVRVHPDPAFRLTPIGIIEVKEDREVYLVPNHMAQQLSGEFSVLTLFTTINRQGVVHLWPVKLPGSDGKHNEWHRSAMEAAERAMEHWVRVTANMSLGAYEIREATGDLAEPNWPASFEEILKVAFRDRIVDRADHPLVHRLQGVL